jgi:6-hydroxynicotinate 3-monooxygenase
MERGQSRAVGRCLSCHDAVHGLGRSHGDAAVLARCVAQSDDYATAFKLYQATRMSRVSKVQQISAENSFLRTPTDPTWVFGYDAVNVALGLQQQLPVAARGNAGHANVRWGGG